MSQFKFSLEAVLTVRDREEQVATANWAAAMQAQATAQQALVAGKEALEEAHRVVEATRRKTFRPGDHELLLATTTFQKETCDRLSGELQEAIEFTKKQHIALLEARMKHEVLVRLKEKKKNEHESRVLAQEEAALADLIIGRYGIRKIHA